MRQIVLDTETTGLEISENHRIIEIGCVELMHRRLTGRTFHRYLNPGREIDAAAIEVHGLTLERLAHEPSFAQIHDELLEFLGDAELIIHNAAFDIGFLNHELKQAGSTVQDITNRCRVLDTLLLARRLHPGQKNNLDALCRRYGIDNSQREWHGALLDARILAEVYLAMTGGQVSLLPEAAALAEADAQAPADIHPVARQARRFQVLRASAEELSAHADYLARLDKASGGSCLWRRLEEQTEPITS